MGRKEFMPNPTTDLRVTTSLAAIQLTIMSAFQSVLAPILTENATDTLLTDWLSSKSEHIAGIAAILKMWDSTASLRSSCDDDFPLSVLQHRLSSITQWLVDFAKQVNTHHLDFEAMTL